MYPTAELRWFFPGHLPLPVIEWYESTSPLFETQDPRTDYYLNLVGSGKMSIKVREGRLEVKRRYWKSEIAELHPNITGQLEYWRKWSIDLGNAGQASASLETSIWIPVTKSRKLSIFQHQKSRWRPVSFDLAPFKSGCEMELTILKVSSQVWWTVAFEAFGAAASNRAALLSVSNQIFAGLDPPELSAQNSFGYPTWLDKIA